MLLKTEICHVSIKKESNLEVTTAVLPYCTSPVCRHVEQIERRQRQRQTELGMSKNHSIHLRDDERAERVWRTDACMRTYAAYPVTQHTAHSIFSFYI